MQSAKVEALNIYPVKSLAGMTVKEAVLTASGLSGDREWMLVDKNNKYVTQRSLPQMALVQAQWQDNLLQLSAPDRNTLVIAPPRANAALHTVYIWKDTCKAQAASDETNAWLTDACKSKHPLRLMHFHKATPRPIDIERFGHNNTFFADAAPYLMANTASLNALNKTLDANHEPQVTMARFRANIILNGIPAFDEHKISTLQNKNFNFSMVDHCQRCAIITIDPNSGIKHPKQSPIRSLAQTNSMPGKPKAPAFGVNCILQNGGGLTLRLGDAFAYS